MYACKDTEKWSNEQAMAAFRINQALNLSESQNLCNFAQHFVKTI